jgi:hypothetical protein
MHSLSAAWGCWTGSVGIVRSGFSKKATCDCTYLK